MERGSMIEEKEEWAFIERKTCSEGGASNLENGFKLK
jgi:hypothetical protein